MHHTYQNDTNTNRGTRPKRGTTPYKDRAHHTTKQSTPNSTTRGNALMQ